MIAWQTLKIIVFKSAYLESKFLANNLMSCENHMANLLTDEWCNKILVLLDWLAQVWYLTSQNIHLLHNLSFKLKPMLVWGQPLENGVQWMSVRTLKRRLRHLGRVQRNCAHGTGYFAKMLNTILYLCNFHFFAVQLKHTLNFFVRLIYANLNAARNRNEICVEIIDEGRFQARNSFASVTNWSNKLMKNGESRCELAFSKSLEDEEKKTGNNYTDKRINVHA